MRHTIVSGAPHIGCLLLGIGQGHCHSTVNELRSSEILLEDDIPDSLTCLIILARVTVVDNRITADMVPHRMGHHRATVRLHHKVDGGLLRRKVDMDLRQQDIHIRMRRRFTFPQSST